MVEEVTVVNPEANSEEPESSCGGSVRVTRSRDPVKHTQTQVFVSGGEKGGDSGGNVGGEEEEVAAERVLKRKIA